MRTPQHTFQPYDACNTSKNHGVTKQAGMGTCSEMVRERDGDAGQKPREKCAAGALMCVIAALHGLGLREANKCHNNFMNKQMNRKNPGKARKAAALHWHDICCTSNIDDPIQQHGSSTAVHPRLPIWQQQATADTCHAWPCNNGCCQTALPEDVCKTKQRRPMQGCRTTPSCCPAIALPSRPKCRHSANAELCTQGAGWQTHGACKNTHQPQIISADACSS